MAKYRCNGCWLLFPESKLKWVDDDDYCPTCAKRWYIVRLHGKTAKTVPAIRKALRQHGFPATSIRIVVPKTPVQRKQGGLIKKTLRTKYSGYVLIEMVRNFQMIGAIESASGVTGFLPLKQRFFKIDPYTKRVSKRRPTEREERAWLDGWKPQCVASEEAAMVLIEQEFPPEKRKPCKADLKVGEMAIVLQGEKRGMEGKIVKIDDNQPVPEVWLEKTLLGVPTVFRIPCWQMEA